MNDLRNLQASPDDDSRLDRLVDGELPTEEYRALLASLDDQPGGWRRCAVAFLEAQALQRELDGMRQTLNLDEGPSNPNIERGPSGPSPAPKRFGPFEWKTLLAIGASFLVAFGLGVAGPRWLASRRAEQPVMNAGLAQPLSSGVVSDHAGNQPGSSLGTRHQSFRPIGNVRLVVNGGGSPSAKSMPVYPAPDDMQAWMNQDQPTLSPELVQQLESRGHQVQRQKQYIPVQLEDGRQIIVPVEGYQITPGSGPMY